jgi:hypothetical protein
MRVSAKTGGRFGDKVPERQPIGDNSVAKEMMGEESSMAAEGGQEPSGGIELQGSGELQSGDGGQP